MEWCLLLCLLTATPHNDAELCEFLLHPKTDVIERVVADLDSDDPAVRQQAVLALHCVGFPAERAIEARWDRRRVPLPPHVSVLLRDLKSNKLPEVCDAKIRGLTQCRHGDWSNGIDLLLDHNARELVLQLLEQIKEQDTSRGNDQLSRICLDVARLRIIKEKFDDAEFFLRYRVRQQPLSPAANRHLALFLYDRGMTVEQISQPEFRASIGDEPRQQGVLAWFLRFSGKHAEALQLAEELQDDGLRKNLAFVFDDASCWFKSRDAKRSSNLDNLTLRIALQHDAGRHESVSELLKELRALFGRKDALFDEAARHLSLVPLPDKAVQLAREVAPNPTGVFTLLAEQGRYREAFEALGM